jgi:hypothetical protein
VARKEASPRFVGNSTPPRFERLGRGATNKEVPCAILLQLRRRCGGLLNDRQC